MAASDVFGIVGTTQAGNFHVERVVAEGGFGVVYRALHGGFRAPVALKCLKVPEQMSKTERAVFLEKFREEAELMFRLSAAITEVCRPLHVDVLHLSDGRFVPFLALEWLEGESLDGIITRRRESGQPPLGLHKVVKMMRPIAAALAKAHHFPGSNGFVSIIHRDLKPENIFVTKVGGVETIKILDYGIAKAKSSASQAAGRVTGRSIREDENASFTPAYGAPEQWSPKTWGETGPWTDVWGLALCLTEALCGAPVIDGDTYVMRRTALDEKRRPTPRANGADVPMEIEKIFERALAVDPRKRYKDIESFFGDLEKAMGLTPSLGPRDNRREPSDSNLPSPGIPMANAAHPADRPRAVRDDRLERIELTPMPRAPLVANAPASKPMAKSAPIAEEPPIASSKPRPAVAAFAMGPQAAPNPAPAMPALASKKPEPSGSWEFDLGSGRSPSEPPRRDSMELELPLHTGANPAPALNDLEASLSEANPISSRMLAEVTAPAPAPASKPGPVRRASMELELSLPTLDSDPPSPPRESASAGGAPIDLADEIPRLDAAPLPLTPIGAQKAPAPAGAIVERPQPVQHKIQVRLSERPHDSGQRLKAPVAILLSALAVALADYAYHRSTGGQLALGPIRAFWIAAPLALVGVGFMLWRLMEGHVDEE